MQHTRQWQVLTCGVAMALALGTASTFAAQNVGNPSQKGSLLIFPAIDVHPGQATEIQIANDANRAVDVQCHYVNESKGRASFMFKLTKKQSVSWNVASGDGDPVNVTPFPTTGPMSFGDPFVGELICFAVNGAGSRQISFNHLSGTATLYWLSDGAHASYNSINFTARAGTLGQPHGTPGRLDLTGADDGHAYDACPAYTIGHFAPTGSPSVVSEAVTNENERIAVSTCAQDLRQDFTPHWTKLHIPVWNANEVKFGGAFECSDGTHHFWLTDIDVLPGSTSFAVLRTSAAQLQLRGLASNQCTPFLPPGAVTEATGLVATKIRYKKIIVCDPLQECRDERAYAIDIGIGAGVSGVPGFVLWDPYDDFVPERR